MDCSIFLKKIRAKIKLAKLINANAPKEKILAQSKILDKYILIQFKYMNECKEKKLVS